MRWKDMQINLSKKTIIIICVIIFIILLIPLIALLKNREKKITDIIDKGTLSRVEYIKTSNGENIIDVDGVISDLKQSRFKPYKGDLGNTARLTYIYMDENNNILFRYTDMGNNGIIGININNKDYYYIKQGVLG
jgi:hypothetical protein